MIKDEESYLKFRVFLIQTIAMIYQAFNVLSPNPVSISEAVKGVMKGVSGKNFGWERIVDFLKEYPHSLKKTAIFESLEDGAATVYKKGYIEIPPNDVLPKHFIRNLIYKLMCIDVHITLNKYGIKNCANGNFDGQQKNVPATDNKVVVISLKEMKGILWGDVDQIRLEAKHGTGLASGKTFIQVDLCSGSVSKIEAGAWQIRDGKLLTIDYKYPDEGTPGHKLKGIVDRFFLENPKEIKKLHI